VGILAVECSEKDLEPTPPSRGKKTRLLPRVSKKEKPVSKPRSIDLHGNTVEEAMVRVEKIVNDSILDNVEYLEIIHGVGTGKIRDAVHRYLSTLNVVSEYKQILSNPGITRVYF
jgi:DNA mismatch repair protein MutS2